MSQSKYKAPIPLPCLSPLLQVTTFTLNQYNNTITNITMDFVKSAVSKVSNKDDKKDDKSDSKQKDDYGDKAFSAVNDKAGFGMSRDQQEKVTDGARDAYEKYSG